MKPEILFISTIHRMSERIMPAIKSLNKDFDIKILNTGQASFNTEYKANLRYRKYLIDNFSKDSIFNTSKISHKGESRGPDNCRDIFLAADALMTDRTVAVILDDSRHKFFSQDLYKAAKKRECKVFANTHGNISFKQIPLTYGLSHEKFYDHIFVFGDYERDYMISLGCDKNFVLTGGIPENDAMSDAKRTNEYILVVPNFILQREVGGYQLDFCKNALALNKSVIKKMKLLSLQQKLGKKVFIKLKHRMSSPCDEEIETVRNIIPKDLEYDLIHHIDSEKSLMSGASCVLTYGSTMSFKPIQLRIPTVIYKDLGYVGNFSAYSGVINVGDSYEYILKDGFIDSEREKFLKGCLSGGVDFTSLDSYLTSFYNNLGDKK